MVQTLLFCAANKDNAVAVLTLATQARNIGGARRLKARIRIEFDSGAQRWHLQSE
jgi:hypothetical protein